MAVFTSEMSDGQAIIHIDLTFQFENGGTGTRDVSELRMLVPDRAWIGYDSLRVPCRMIIHMAPDHTPALLEEITTLLQDEIPASMLAQMAEEFRALAAAIGPVLSRLTA